MITFVKQLIVKLQEAITKKSSNWPQGISIINDDLKIAIALLNSTSLKHFHFEYTDYTTAQFFRSVSPCWEYQAELRARAVCSTCSANSARFFDSSKALASVNTCDSVVSKCQVCVFQMNRLIHAMMALSEHQDLLAKFNIHINADKRLKNVFMMAFKNYQSDFSSSMHEVSLGEFIESLLKSPTKKAEYCDHLIRLNIDSVPYALTFAELIHAKIPWILTVCEKNRSLDLMDLEDDQFTSSSDFENESLSQDTKIMASSISNKQISINKNQFSQKNEQPMDLSMLQFP